MTTQRMLSGVFLSLSRVLPLLILAFGSMAAAAQSDPPARVGNLSHLEGTAALAPPGDSEWTDAVLNRPITRGDRLWTDRGARAEVHLGSAVLHVDGETFLDFTALDAQVLQASLNEGTVNARVRELDAGENFEIDTPQLALRASQPGDYRIDVDSARGTTRVTVRSGMALVYGAGGEAQQLQAGRQITFTGRELERVAVQSPQEDGFDRWAADRNRREDESLAARYIPREVVGYHQLDAYGSWAQDPSYGMVWFPRVTVADWAPYRYGHWEWISPWGWTWIDDAPWGFAPFHYGRWTTIGSRWCWVPGRIGPQPIYAPALVAFIGSGSGWSLTLASGPGIGWYPLAPGEAWRPYYRSSPVYVRNVNRNIVVNSQSFDSAAAHAHRRRGEAITAMRVEDFSRGRPVPGHWSRVSPAEVARAPLAPLASMPAPRRFGDAARGGPARTQAPAPNSAPAAVVPREPLAGTRPGLRPRDDARAQEQPPRRAPRPQAEVPRRPFEQGPDRRANDEQRAQDNQRRQQQQEQARRDQQVRQERDRREQQQAHEQQEQRRAQQEQLQREQALRQQQAQQERRQQQQMRQREQEQRQQQALQERQQHQQRLQEQREQRPQQAAQERPRAQIPAPAAVQAGPPQRGEGRERAAQRDPGGRGERRSPDDGDGRGRGQGPGRGG
ncbi:MAG: chromosome partitioning protein ParA [Ramlibacter sp.]|nr:chromosome partitioning protein ParA [Ramlibacter sp.]